jgi:hypothetical protein
MTIHRLTFLECCKRNGFAYILILLSVSLSSLYAYLVNISFQLSPGMLAGIALLLLIPLILGIYHDYRGNTYDTRTASEQIQEFLEPKTFYYWTSAHAKAVLACSLSYCAAQYYMQGNIEPGPLCFVWPLFYVLPGAYLRYLNDKAHWSANELRELDREYDDKYDTHNN